jgi:SAM-dependent methyltransferase
VNVTVGDAYGQLLLAELVQGGGVEIVEREDGYIAASLVGPAIYLAPFRRWSSEERRGMRFARGRVLDVGSGGGRVCLHLQERGHEVVGIDNSPLAIEVCRMRGVRDARLVAIEDVDDSLGRFDTIVMYGNNFGLVGGAKQAGRILRRFHALTSPRGRILATSRDIYRTEDPIHLAYQARNRERGRMSGQIRIRIRYRDVASPWFDYLMVSPDEMQELAEPAGWRVARVLQGEDTYVAVLEKRASERSGPG